MGTALVALVVSSVVLMCVQVQRAPPIVIDPLLAGTCILAPPQISIFKHIHSLVLLQIVAIVFSHISEFVLRLVLLLGL